MDEWQQGICGCFGDLGKTLKHGLNCFICFHNLGTCLLAYFVPCYLIGLDAESVGDSCLLCGLLSILIIPCTTCLIRQKVREKRNIGGNCLGDFLCSWFCTCCTVAQMHHEVRHMQGNAMAMDRE